MDDEEIPTLIEHQSEQSKRVPLTIICGFLGAGKSTLLKRILTERHGYRIAVIMNEFGDTADIEAKTINVGDGDDPASRSDEFLELANGCLCCSIKDVGIAAIEKLMERRGAFDHIVLETTGLADPGPIASIFWQNEEYAMGLGRDIALDGVVCVVDALFGRQQIEEDSISETSEEIGESIRQIAGSDVIVLNKIDLVKPEQVSETQRLIRQANPVAPIHRTVRGKMDIGLLLGIRAYSSAPEITIHPEHNHAVGHADDDDCEVCRPHYELHGISALHVSVPVLDATHMEGLDEWVRAVLWDGQLPESLLSKDERRSADIVVLRCKGVFSTTEGTRYVLQGVRSLYDIFAVEEADLGLPSEGKLVFIGRGLNEEVRRSLMERVA